VTAVASVVGSWADGWAHCKVDGARAQVVESEVQRSAASPSLQSHVAGRKAQAQVQALPSTFHHWHSPAHACPQAGFRRWHDVARRPSLTARSADRGALRHGATPPRRHAATPPQAVSVVCPTPRTPAWLPTRVVAFAHFAHLVAVRETSSSLQRVCAGPVPPAATPEANQRLPRPVTRPVTALSDPTHPSKRPAPRGLLQEVCSKSHAP
jgi:hypothetical protein